MFGSFHFEIPANTFAQSEEERMQSEIVIPCRNISAWARYRKVVQSYGSDIKHWSTSSGELHASPGCWDENGDPAPRGCWDENGDPLPRGTWVRKIRIVAHYDICTDIIRRTVLQDKGLNNAHDWFEYYMA